MLDLEIPGRGRFQLRHLVLDVNGTVCRDGELLPGVVERLAELRGTLTPHLVSADTQGRLDAIAASLDVNAYRLERGAETEQKAAFVRRLGASAVVAIGNGANDAQMLTEAALGLAVLGPEGLALAAWQAADVLAHSIADALDLLRFPKRLIATLRR